ncbi:MAG: DNA polymerase III subunit alpha [Candidatus Paceibacterota bacterium]
MSKFVHLHTHSHYSLLTALPKVPELVAYAKKNGMSALALTDDANLYGAIEFYRECKDAGIKPIIGIDAFVALRTRHDKQAGVDNKRHRLVLLAEDNTGYKNLMKLSTDANLEGFYYKPRVDHELLEKYHEGLIAILPCFSGEVSDKLRTDDTEGAKQILSQYIEIFGEDNVFLEITRHPEDEEHEEFNKKILSLADDFGAQIVATHEIYYLEEEDRQARETLLAIQSSSHLRQRDEEVDLSFISQKEMEKRFKDIPEAIENAGKIAERCNIEIELGNAYFPDIQIPDNTTFEEELRRKVEEGFEKRGLEKSEKAIERMEYELGIINDKGYPSYFLVVADLIRFANENGIPSNIRGSVSGSLVTYLLGITNLNPFEYGLVFERFLNPDRPSLPDIDMDFADDRRDEVIEYSREKYGKDKVAQIGTFGTMMARGAVRDVARALGYPYALGDRIAKLIPFGQQGFPMTIERALEMEPDLRKIYDEEPEVQEVIDMAQKIEGCARHISVHAAGVVIAPDEITNFTPIQLDPKGGKLITQYDMYSVEETGLPKFDFLGLKNLSILADTLKRIKWRHGIEMTLDGVPVDDEKTFELLSRGETMGLFQLNGQGMTHFLKELKPTDIHDINAMVALYRPGPMEFIPEYIKRKHNPEVVDYPHELLKEDLEKSYGLLIYQEDVMMTAIKLAGYSWLEADKFRKAMGKKIPELMAKQEEKFKSGCIENGIEADLVEDLWERIKPFAAYAFNKNHSASYGHVAYQTAYFKANYPIEYMASILTADSGDVDKIAEAVNECKRMDIEILPPDINESFGTFTIVEPEGEESEAIRFGLYTIKNFGEGIADAIIEERKEHGPYESLANFLDRVHDRNLNRKSLESLIKCGALDAFGERGEMTANIEGLLEYNKEQSKVQNQDSLFGGMEDEIVSTLTLKPTEAASKEEKLGWEKELLGLYISGHPLDKHREKLEGRRYTIEKIKETLNPGMVAVAAGIIEDVKSIITKRGDKMAFVRIADFTDSLEIVVFPNTFKSFEDILTPESCVAIKGKMSDRNNEKSLIAEAVKEM